MAEESEIFIFSPESYVFGATITIHLWTLYSSVNLYFATNSKWYAAIAALAVGRICEVCMSVRIMALGIPGDMAALEVVQQVVSCACQVAFAWMRTRRFQQLSTPSTTPRPLTLLILVLTVLSITLSTLLNLLGIVAMFVPATVPHIGSTYLPFILFDSLVTLVTAYAVVSTLRTATWATGSRVTMPSIHAPPSGSKGGGDHDQQHIATDNTAATRKSEVLGLTKVERIGTLLGFESTLLVSVLLALNASPDWDPYWSSVYLGWAIQGRCFCEYVDLAGRILGVSGAGKGGGVMQSSMATSSFAHSSDGAGGGHGHGVGAGSSVGRQSETIPPGVQVETSH